MAVLSEPEMAEHDAGAGGSRPELDLNQFLPYRFNALADRISQALSRIYNERFGISVAQWRVLAWISHKDVLTAKQICEYTRMDKARVSRAVQTLEQRGFITRTQSSDDLRVQHLRLTEPGEQLLSALIPAAHGWEADLVGRLSVTEYRDLLNALGKLERQLDRLEQQEKQER